MVDHRKELSEEVLGFDFNPSLKRMNAFLGFCLGYMVGTPVFAAIESVTFLFPALSFPKNAYFFFLGLSSVVGLIWGYLAGAKYDGFSVRFNKDSLTLYKDRISKQQVLWTDVLPIRRSWNMVIETRQGLSIEIPMMVLRDSTHEVRALSNHLKKFVPAPKAPNAMKWLVVTALLFVVGVALLISFPKPKEVFADADPGQVVTWLRAIPAVLGGVLAQIGVFGLLACASILMNKKKPSPYHVTDEGIVLKGKQLWWVDLKEMKRSGSQDMVLRLVPKKGRTWEVYCQRYIDGEQLRDSILAHSLVLAKVPNIDFMQTPIVVRLGRDQRGSVIFIAGFGVLMLAIAICSLGFHGLATRPGDTPVIGYIGAFGAPLFLGLALLAWKTVTLSGEGLISKWLIFPPRVIRLSDIQTIEIRTVQSKDRTYDCLIVKSAKAKIGASSSMSQYAELRDALLSVVPGEKIRLS